MLCEAVKDLFESEIRIATHVNEGGRPPASFTVNQGFITPLSRDPSSWAPAGRANAMSRSCQTDTNTVDEAHLAGNKVVAPAARANPKSNFWRSGSFFWTQTPESNNSQANATSTGKSCMTGWISGQRPGVPAVNWCKPGPPLCASWGHDLRKPNSCKNQHTCTQLPSCIPGSHTHLFLQMNNKHQPKNTDSRAINLQIE